jgi:Ca-activated chloride channel family protein
VSDVSFAHLELVHLVWAVVGFTALLLILERRGSAGLSRFMSKLMQQRLVSRSRPWRRYLRIVLLGACGLCLVVALMRPQSGFHRVAKQRVGAEIMICLDVSRSMLADDVVPDRLRRSKAEILDLLGYLGDDHVGLIAFAGKATVLCPLTPDFGFLRLVLDSTGPHSVARGGTDLEAPIRKALAGFRGKSDVSRCIFLITDGDDKDHASFAIDAAKEAAQSSIAIVTIGFGDPDGSHIMITDPKTGARVTLRDANGEPVQSRLGADLLSRIALETGGAFVPAGTGAIDLKSIYVRHIEPLARGRLNDTRQLVKRERYRWAVLSALASLLAAAAVGSGAAVRAASTPARGAVAAALLLLAAAPVFAQADEDAADQAAQEPVPAEAPKAEDDGEPPAPRLVYNQALSKFEAGELEDAEADFGRARDGAGSDVEARYRATYNLGWVHVKRADNAGQDHAAALEHLKAASAWFRESVRLAPAEEAPRRNLQIVGRRMMALADKLQSGDAGALAAQIDELINGQRGLVESLKQTVSDDDGQDRPALTEAVRRACRGHEVQQRQILGRVQQVTQAAADELDRLEAIEQDKRTGPQRLRHAQLTYLRAHLHQATLRVGQTRRSLRAGQAGRAYRRAAVALDRLKRARDQLRDLVQVLGDAATDARDLTKRVGRVAASSAAAALGGPQKPAWLTYEYLEDAVGTQLERVEELVARVMAGLDAPSEDDVAAGDDQAPKAELPSPPAADDAQAARARATLQQAAPLLAAAADASRQAQGALQSQQDEEAYAAAARATMRLLEATELFLDERGLIEATYVDQKRIETALAGPVASEAPGEMMPLLQQLQDKNVQRAERLDGMFADALASAESIAGPGGGGAASASGVDHESQDAERARNELARQLLHGVRETFGALAGALQDAAATDPGEQALADLRRDAGEAVKQVDDLRRLFLSVVEHLRRALREQIDLADKTRDAATLGDEDQKRKRAGPLREQQVSLVSTTRAIAEALRAQSQHPQPDGAADANATDMAQRLLESSKHVESAADAMDEAAAAMEAEDMNLDAAGGQQKAAAQGLAEALKLLEPPQDDKQKQEQKQQQEEQKQEQKQDENQASKPQPTPQERQGRFNAQQLLQNVRDKEAQRRRNRNKGSARYAPVEKDW